MFFQRQLPWEHYPFLFDTRLGKNKKAHFAQNNSQGVTLNWDNIGVGNTVSVSATFRVVCVVSEITKTAVRETKETRSLFITFYL